MRLSLAVLALPLCACSLVRFQEKRLEHRFRRDGLEQHTVQIDGATVRYWEGGEGEPLLLLHGFGAHAVWQWEKQVHDFAKTRHIVVPDLLWFGGSKGRPGDYTLLSQSDTMSALLAQRGLERADVVGISYGGLVAWALAVQHPEQVDQLVLIDSPGPVFTPEDHEALLARLGVQSVAELVVPDGPEAVDRLMKLAWADPPRVPRFLLRDAWRNLYPPPQDDKVALIADLLAHGFQWREEALRVDAPLLVVWGREDPLFPLEVGERLVQSQHNAQLLILDDAAHAPNLEQWRALDEGLARFFGP